MKVSLNTVKQYVNFELPAVDELVHYINQQLGGVEEVIELGKKYEGATIVRVIECAPVEGSDHLNVTKVDDGGVVDGVERDENGLVQVVCGAPNVHADMFAVWLAPGTTVPESFDDEEPFVLGARQLRGVMSNGMLASAKELAFGDSHEGILEIDPSEWKPNDIEIKPGASFAEVYGLNDTIVDIENKMFTHRPDCFGQLGVAREIAGIFGQKFNDPEWYWNMPNFEHAEGLELEVFNDAQEKVPRFMAVAMKNVTVKSSPIWLQAELVRLGAKPISNIVDVTNYVMLLTAQPTHAYDYDKLRGHKIGVRMAGNGDKAELLNGKTYELNENDIVIVDGEGVIGLGGIMGGGNSEVSAETKNIVLEVANFDMYTLRRSSMRHGLFTDASTRFTKGQSPLQNDRVLNLLMQSVKDTAGGEQASPVVDLHESNEVYERQSLAGSLSVSEQFINERLGLEMNADQIGTLLENVHFEVANEDGGALVIKAPFWRTDIELPEDIVEEVGRLYGFEKLPQELPKRSLKPAVVNPRLALKRKLREVLSQAGANEVLTYSFVHRNVLEKAGQNADDTYQLSNALSPDLHYLRRSVLPSLLDKVHQNVRAGYGTFAIFEIGKGHKKAAGFDEQGVPVEQEFLSLALANGGFYQAKAFVEFLADKLHLKFKYVPLEQGKLFEPKRGALVKVGNDVVGAVGEFRSTIRRNFKLPDTAAGFELDFDKLTELAQSAEQAYRPLGRFPSVERDITLQVAADVPFARVNDTVLESLSSTGLEVAVTPAGIYKPEDADTKNITLHIRLASNDKTMTGEEVSNIIETLAKSLSEKLQASIV